MEQLKKLLTQIDAKGYKSYKEIQGSYRTDSITLHIDHIQSDPFAPPSRARVFYKGDLSFIKQEWLTKPHLKITLEDWITRVIAERLNQMEQNSAKEKLSKNLILIDSPGQEVLSRTSCNVHNDSIEVRLSIQLPARGRRILSRHAIKLLVNSIPELFKDTFQYFDVKRCESHLLLAEQQFIIRNYLIERGYIAFVANGSILPRQSGISQRPLSKRNAIPFQSPKELEITIPLSNKESIRGMGIPKGITLIVGGGYHGKSTLLKAIELGIYNHIKEDGREWVLTDQSALKIRAEDGRNVEKVNISPFISDLPFGKETDIFSTKNASGSTSQAANIIEAIELQTKVLLIDEDTSATNFMIRDARMQQLVAKEKEPITPYVDKIRQLYDDQGISTILVLGGSGDYFDLADHIIMMDEYRPIDVTAKAKEIASTYKQMRKYEGGTSFGQTSSRIILKDGFSTHKGHKEKADGRGLHTILFGNETIDLSFIEQIVHPSQTRAIANIMRYLEKNSINGTTCLTNMLDVLFERIMQEGLDFLSQFRGNPGDMALPRKYEVAAAINRLRSLKVKVSNDNNNL